MAEWRNGGMKRQTAKTIKATKATTPTLYRAAEPPSRRAAMALRLSRRLPTRPQTPVALLKRSAGTLANARRIVVCAAGDRPGLRIVRSGTGA